MQFVSVFIIVLLIEIVLFVMIKKVQRKKETKKPYRFLTLVLFILIWAVTIRFIVFPPTREIPTTGAYQIESLDYWIDEDRADPYLDDGTMRQLQVRKWYPVNSNESHPVIIASHGSCGTIDNNVSL